MTQTHRSVRRRLQQWLPTPESLRDHPRVGHWLRPLSDPRLWALQRRTVALGAALGAFFCVIPLPVQMPLAALAAILLRANLPAAIGATLISNPVTMVAILTGAWKIGSLMLGEVPAKMPFDPARLAFGSPWVPSAWIPALNGIAGALLLGLPVIGAALGAATYLLVMLGWRWAALHRWRTRRIARESR
jgi:uncharacterized protein (DUF2062 family)